LWTGPLEQPGDRFAAVAAQVAPRAEVHVLRPGEAATVHRWSGSRANVGYT
jgi:hypothetical protein